MMKNYTIRAEPTGHVYQALLGLSLQHCETFILVVGSEPLLERPRRDVLERLSPLVITRSEEQEWPGTKLIGGPTSTVWRFKLSDEAVESGCSGRLRLVIFATSSRSVYRSCRRSGLLRHFRARRRVASLLGRIYVMAYADAVPAGQAAKMPVSRYARSTTARP